MKAKYINEKFGVPDIVNEYIKQRIENNLKYGKNKFIFNL